MLVSPVVAAYLSDIDIGDIPTIFLEDPDDGILIGLGVIAGSPREGLVIKEDDITFELVFVVFANLTANSSSLSGVLTKKLFRYVIDGLVPVRYMRY